MTALVEERAVEHADDATVSVIDDDIRAAASTLRLALAAPDFARPAAVEAAARSLLSALADAPETDTTECPGVMVVVRSSVWHGQIIDDLQCTVCGREATS